MTSLQVKDVPPDLHEAVRRRAAAEGMTVSDYVLDLIRRDLSVPSQRQWLETLSAREPIEVEDVVDVLTADRGERDQELSGR